MLIITKDDINRFYRIDISSRFSLESVSKNIPSRIVRLIGFDRRKRKPFKVRIYMENGKNYDYFFSIHDFIKYTPLPIFGDDGDLEEARKIGKLDKIK